MVAETARLLGALAHPPVIHLVSPCETTREFAAAELQALAPAPQVVVEASASAAATVTSVLRALACLSPERELPQEDIRSTTPVPQR